MNDVVSRLLPFSPPETVFPRLCREPYFCYLDSCPGSGGRFSVMGTDPFVVMKSRAGRISVTQGGETRAFPGNPFEYLRHLLRDNDLSNPSFFGPGLMGFAGYDAGRYLEKVPVVAADDLQVPDMVWCAYGTVLVFDLRARTLTARTMRRGRSDDRARRDLDVLRDRVSGTGQPAGEAKDIPAPDVRSVTSNMTHEYYVECIGRIREYIRRGDVYQINFARRICAEGDFDTPSLYARLRGANPTGYSGYFDAGDFRLLSNSPEIFLVREGDRVWTRPMKGTRPRGETPERDEAYARELMASEKDAAELVMIVDLERNDIGKVCRYGSVGVPDLRRLETYDTVYQTTALVEGSLAEDAGCMDLVTAAFPGGSITGAPKFRAMEIIEELEPNRRDFYTGSMGYIGFNGAMQLNILIRTMLLRGAFLYYPVGGGIVWDSDAEEEFRETQTKAEALFRALGTDDES